MSEIEGEAVLTRDTSSGRIHRRILLPTGQLLTDEKCNLDQAGAYTILTGEEGAAALANSEPGQLCENDFPDVGA